MRLWLAIALAAALLAAGGASALAGPSLGGPTGIVTLPTARVAPVDEWQTAVGYRNFRAGFMYEPIDVSLWSFQLLKGVSSDAELWVAYTRASNGEDANVWEYGGKYQIGEHLIPRPGILAGTDMAIGLSLGRWADALCMYDSEMFFTDKELLRSYFVITKQLSPAYTGEWPWDIGAETRIIGTFGLLYLQVDPDLGDRETLLKWFLGLEIIGKGRITFATEYRPKDGDLEDDPVFSTLIRYKVDDQMDFEFGLTNASPIGLGFGDQDLFLRLTYSVPVITY